MCLYDILLFILRNELAMYWILAKFSGTACVIAKRPTVVAALLCIEFLASKSILINTNTPIKSAVLLSFKGSLQLFSFVLSGTIFIAFSKSSSHTCVPGVIFCVPSPLPLSLNTFVLLYFLFSLHKGLSFLDFLCVFFISPWFLQIYRLLWVQTCIPSYWWQC